jgi:topoisomerase IA-like protein
MEDLFAYTFTASMERQLDEIAEGKGEERVLLQNVWESYKERYESLLSSSSSSASSSSSSPSSPSSSSSSSSASSTALVPSLTQKVFRNGIKAVQTKKGPLLLREGATKEDTVFFGWPSSVSWEKITEQKAKEHIAIVTEEREGLVIAPYRDRPVVKKKGQYGFYLRWDAITLPFVEGESVEALHARLEQRTSSASSSSASSSPSAPSAPQGLIKETSQYLIRSGPYGPYMMKKTTTTASSTSAGKSKKTIFVSVPKGLDVAPLTDKEIDALYKAGLEAKKASLEAKKNRPSRASVKENQDEE